MLGHDVLNLRLAMGLSPSALAEILGVHASTVYRWEAAGDRIIHVDSMQAKILAALSSEVSKRKAAESQAEFGAAIGAAVLIGGGLFALFKVLEEVFDEKKSGRS